MIRAVRDLSALEVVHPRVAMALRAKSGSERLRLAKRLLRGNAPGLGRGAYRAWGGAEAPR